MSGSAPTTGEVHVHGAAVGLAAKGCFLRGAAEHVRDPAHWAFVRKPPGG